MRSILISVVMLTFCLAIYAGSVESVRSQDLSDTKNQITITLLGSARETISSPDSKTIWITVSNSVETPTPSYSRLSKVIDRISTTQLGKSTIIEIKTMDQMTFSTNRSSTGDDTSITITLSIDSNKKLTGVPAQTAKTPSSRPSVSDTRKTSLQNTKPLSAPKPSETKDKSALPNPTPGGDSTQVVAGTDSTPQTVKPFTEMEKSAPGATAGDRRNPEQAGDKKGRSRQTLLIFLVCGAALVLILLIIWFFFRRKPMETPEPEPEEKTLGRTLLLDGETRKRMVRKLIDQGWTAGEIARELKVEVFEVEEIEQQRSDETDRDDD